MKLTRQEKCALHWRQKKYFNYPDITYRNKYIHEYI